MSDYKEDIRNILKETYPNHFFKKVYHSNQNDPSGNYQHMLKAQA